MPQVEGLADRLVGAPAVAEEGRGRCLGGDELADRVLGTVVVGVDGTDEDPWAGERDRRPPWLEGERDAGGPVGPGRRLHVGGVGVHSGESCPGVEVDGPGAHGDPLARGSPDGDLVARSLAHDRSGSDADGAVSGPATQLGGHRHGARCGRGGRGPAGDRRQAQRREQAQQQCDRQAGGPAQEGRLTHRRPPRSPCSGRTSWWCRRSWRARRVDGGPGTMHPRWPGGARRHRGWWGWGDVGEHRGGDRWRWRRGPRPGSAMRSPRAWDRSSPRRCRSRTEPARRPVVRRSWTWGSGWHSSRSSGSPRRTPWAPHRDDSGSAPGAGAVDVHVRSDVGGVVGPSAVIMSGVGSGRCAGRMGVGRILAGWWHLVAALVRGTRRGWRRRSTAGASGPGSRRAGPGRAGPGFRGVARGTGGSGFRRSGLGRSGLGRSAGALAVGRLGGRIWTVGELRSLERRVGVLGQADVLVGVPGIEAVDGSQRDHDEGVVVAVEDVAVRRRRVTSGPRHRAGRSVVRPRIELVAGVDVDEDVTDAVLAVFTAVGVLVGGGHPELATSDTHGLEDLVGAERVALGPWVQAHVRRAAHQSVAGREQVRGHLPDAVLGGGGKPGQIDDDGVPGLVDPAPAVVPGWGGVGASERDRGGGKGQGQCGQEGRAGPARQGCAAVVGRSRRGTHGDVRRRPLQRSTVEARHLRHRFLPFGP